jgi:hypothetical protein
MWLSAALSSIIVNCKDLKVEFNDKWQDSVFRLNLLSWAQYTELVPETEINSI